MFHLVDLGEQIPDMEPHEAPRGWPRRSGDERLLKGGSDGHMKAFANVPDFHCGQVEGDMVDTRRTHTIAEGIDKTERCSGPGLEGGAKAAHQRQVACVIQAIALRAVHEVSTGWGRIAESGKSMASRPSRTA